MRLFVALALLAGIVLVANSGLYSQEKKEPNFPSGEPHLVGHDTLVPG